MSGSTGSQVSKLAEELLQAIKEPSSEGSMEKLVNMAEDLVKAIKAEGSTEKLVNRAEDLSKTLKVPPKAEANEVTFLGNKVMHMEGGLSEVKANTRLTATITFTIFGVIGCLLVAFPKDIHEVKVKGDTNEKACEARDKNNEIKYKKLKSRIQALEAKAEEKSGPTAEEKSGPTAEKGWFSWVWG